MDAENLPVFFHRPPRSLIVHLLTMALSQQNQPQKICSEASGQVWSNKTRAYWPPLMCCGENGQGGWNQQPTCDNIWRQGAAAHHGARLGGHGPGEHRDLSLHQQLPDTPASWHWQTGLPLWHCGPRDACHPRRWIDGWIDEKMDS